VISEQQALQQSLLGCAGLIMARPEMIQKSERFAPACKGKKPLWVPENSIQRGFRRPWPLTGRR
jgi:hypothetical protein